jgi:hypothetical protein
VVRIQEQDLPRAIARERDEVNRHAAPTSVRRHRPKVQVGGDLGACPEDVDAGRGEPVEILEEPAIPGREADGQVFLEPPEVCFVDTRPVTAETGLVEAADDVSGSRDSHVSRL